MPRKIACGTSLNRICTRVSSGMSSSEMIRCSIDWCRIDGGKDAVYCFLVLFAACAFHQQLRETVAEMKASAGAVEGDLHLETAYRLMQRLVILTVIVLGCFICRLVMLALKFTAIEETGDSAGGIYFGDTVWWILADFIPRIIPSLMWALVIQTPKDSTSGRTTDDGEKTSVSIDDPNNDRQTTISIHTAPAVDRFSSCSASDVVSDDNQVNISTNPVVRH